MAEDSFKFAIQGNRDGIWDWDISAREVYYSKRWKEALGYTDAEIGSTQEELEKRIHSEDRERVLATILEHIKGVSPYYECEYRILCRNGTYKWVLDRGQVCSRSEDGKAERMVGTQTDITELVESRERLHGFENILSTSPDLLAQVDANYRYVLANKNYAAEFNKDSSELIGRTVAEVFGNEFFEQVIKPNVEKTFNGESVRYQEVFNFADTSSKLMDVYYSPLMSESGQWQGFLVSARDITAVTHSKRLLDDSEKRFYAIFEEAPLGIAVIDSHTGHIYQVNPRFGEIVGRSREELLSIDWLSFTHPDDVQKDLDNMALLNEGELEGYTMEKRYIHSDGSIVWVNMTIAPTKTQYDTGPRHLCMIQEITQRKMAQEKLRKSEKGLAAAQRIAKIGSWELDIENNHLVWSDEVYRIFGLEPQQFEATYEGFLEKIHPDDREHVNAVYLASLENKSNYQTEHRLLLPDGKIKYVVEQGESFYDSEGKPIRTIGTVQDVTRRREGESLLLNSNINLSKTEKLAHVGSWQWDIASNIFSGSAQWQMIHGINKSSLTMDELMPIAYPDDVDVINKTFQDVLDGVTSSYEIEHRIIRQDNSEVRHIWALGEVVARDASGRPAKISGFAQDITERKELENSLKRFDRALKNLVNVTQLIIHARSEQELYEKICRSLVEVGGYKFSWISLVVDDDRKSVRPCAQFGFERGYVESLDVSWADIPRGRGPIGIAVRGKKYCLVQDIHNDPRFEPWRAEALENGYRSMISIPIVIDESVIGTINIYAEAVDAFDMGEIDLLVQMSGDLAYGIQSQRTTISNELSLEKLSNSLSQTIEAIALTVEMRDPYTAGHMTRVSELCVAIGKEMGFSKSCVEGLRFGGTIHDLGKIYIPAEILNRPGELSAAEFDLIKTHPQVGYEIVKGIDFPWPIAEMVWQHHERRDGSGYPNGLEGDDIIMEAQILAVADVIEAVSSHRPYRPALSIEDGLDIVIKGRGSLYNAEVVDACIKLFKEDNFKFTSTF